MKIQDKYIFTPGPWHADEGTIRNQAGDALGSYPWGIGDEVDHGNGVLMAAAPELLAACGLTLRTIDDVLRHYEANAKSNQEILEDITALLRGLIIRYKEDLSFVKKG